MTNAFWFDVPLVCLGCGAEIPPAETRLHARGLNPDPRDEWARPGDVLAIELDDFDVAYLRVQDPAELGDARVLDGWWCPVSNETQWVHLEFRDESPTGFRFVSAQSVYLTPEELRQAHFISSAVAQWIRDGPEDQVGELRAVVGSALDRHDH